MDATLAMDIFELDFRATFPEAIAGHYITDMYWCRAYNTIEPKQHNHLCCTPVILRVPYRINNDFISNQDSVFIYNHGEWITYRQFANNA